MRHSVYVGLQRQAAAAAQAVSDAESALAVLRDAVRGGAELAYEDFEKLLADRDRARAALARANGELSQAQEERVRGREVSR
jgi:hypothetical protein